MERRLFAVCPRCGGKARIFSHRWDWEFDQDFALVRCECGIFEAPYSESRVVEIDFPSPYLKENHFLLLIPPGWDRGDLQEKGSKCLEAMQEHF